MKYIKTFEKISLVNFSNLDKVVDKIKNKFKLGLETEFSKYLEPEIVKIGKEDVKVFLFKPDFGVRINVDFTKAPYVLYANVCVVFKEDGKWKRSAYTKHYQSIKSQAKKHLEGLVEKYVSELEDKYKRRENRILKKDIQKYNL